MTDTRPSLEFSPDEPEWNFHAAKRRILLVAINIPGYYSLPVRILSLLVAENRELGQHFDCRFVEYDNNQPLSVLVDKITGCSPDILGFSVNIWNRNQCLETAQQCRDRLPELTILAGGQEVTGSTYNFLDLAKAFDFVLEGEAEVSFLQFLNQWRPDRWLQDPESVSGLTFRDGSRQKSTGPAQVVASLDDIPSVTLAGLVPAQQRFLLGVMLESARGCPFHCSFCFEGSKREKMRMASIPRLRDEILYMVGKGARYFHIMDAILCNSDPARLAQLKAIFDEVKQKHPETIVSVELYADRITPEITRSLSSFSIIDLGLQTTNPDTAKAIHRKFIPQKYIDGVELLRTTGSTFNIYLICGLPYETFLTFLRGIRFVIDLHPTRMFVNELCLLNGTELRQRSAEYGYVYDADPPYLVRASNWMSAATIKLSHVIGKVVEQFQNLSTRSVKPMTPWLPKQPIIRDRPLDLHIPGDCTYNCQECMRASSTTERAGVIDIRRQLNDAADYNVNLFGGDSLTTGMELAKIAGQLQLMASARNCLITPLEPFGKPGVVEELIHRGFWHFCSFLQVETDDEDGQVKEQRRAALRSFNQPVKLAGLSSIQPHLEIIVLPGTGSVHQYCRTLQALTQYKVTVITVPEEVAGYGQEWCEELINMFQAIIDERIWLKLPDSLARKAISRYLPGDNGELDEIISLLHSFRLTSTAANLPPCFTTSPLIST